MIRKAGKDDFDQIQNYISKDYARNYFIALGLLKGLDTFQSIYIAEEKEITGLLFHRKSGNLQFTCDALTDFSGFQSLIRTLDFKYLISPRSFCEGLEPAVMKVKEGAYIAVLNKKDYKVIPVEKVDAITSKDCETIETLYQKVFSGHPKAAFMAEKLKEKRGRGFCIKNEQIQSVAQSEFGNLIVGVATHPEDQKKGYASRCMHQLMQALFKEYENVYLQYDDPIAGRLYEQLGFKPIDQVYYYKRGDE